MKKIFIDNIQVGEYVVCTNDKGNKKHYYHERDEKVLFGIRTETSYKIPSVTKDSIYKIHDKKQKNVRKKMKRTGNFMDSKVNLFKIKSDKGTMVWIPTHRFEYNPEASINQNRFEKLDLLLKD